MDELWWTLAFGMLIGVAATLIAARIRTSSRRAGTGVPISRLIRNHFRPIDTGDLMISERKFPVRVRADLQGAINRLLDTDTTVLHFCGVHSDEEIGFAALCTNVDSSAVSAPPEYEDVDIGEDQPARCPKNGLWLVEKDGNKYAVLCASRDRFSGCGFTQEVAFQIVTANNSDGTRIAQEFFKHLEDAVSEAGSYRGKVLSLEQILPYSGESSAIAIHKLRTVERDEVILPEGTLRLLDRNVVQFAQRRARLSEFGQPSRKGILFYGRPGTGKTHTVHYLAAALAGHTTLLITAEQVSLLSEYMALARLLQPSIVVVEDVDLIAQERTTMDVGQKVLLHRLLNEMDGLTEDARVLFILTTNRPEVLETALASRPGRIDQAIEFPLPDRKGREMLVRLYSRGSDVPQDVVRAVVEKTENTSGAFIKELMRRSLQFHLERSDSASIELEDVDAALEEMLFAGGTLNVKLLGGDVAAHDDQSSQ